MTAAYFDSWFADIARSAARQQLFTEVLQLPPEVGPSNTVPLDGLVEVGETLAVAAEGLLVDVACGRGGPGMWLARSAGTSLWGVDFSAEAVAQATARRDLFGLESRARFTVGSLEATGLPDSAADGLVCVDAFQFASDGSAAAAELRRVLRPGGRVVMTSWEAIDPTDEALGERIRRNDMEGALRSAGFADIEVRERPEWHEAARRLWQRSLELDAAGDPAIESTQNEGRRSLENHDKMRRLLVTAVRPIG